LIIIDSGEPPMMKDMVRRHVQNIDDVQVQLLPVGDYYLVGEEKEMVLTRKTWQDLLGSARTGAFWTELGRMEECLIETRALILEGDPDQVYQYGHGKFPEVFGYVVAVALDWGFPIIPTRTLDETARALAWINKKIGKGGEARHFRIRHLPKISIAERPLYMVQGMKGIGGKKAQDLLRKFKTPLNVFLAEKEELMEVDGIGKKHANVIYDTLRQEWVPPEERKRGKC
jgi:ERCC4-type nuclease